MTLVDEVKQRLDVVDVISRYVPLQPAGRNFKARCPFHTERTPSFIVFPESQTWRCFGACATGGDALGFVMRQEGIPFGEALRRLARETGIELPGPTGQVKSDPLVQANFESAQFYHRYLLQAPEGESVRQYLERRELAPDSVATFLLGLSPDEPDRLRAHLLGLGFAEEQLVEAGLVLQAQGGWTRDRFRRRLMFPISDPQGRVVGFSGRSLDGSDPKYMNTPKTRIFDKGGLLYGLDRSSEAIRASGEAVVVEGYMDVIVPHQAGFRNVVASMGTALTRQQVGLLEELATTCVLALDPDQAGQEAVFRSLEASWQVFKRPEAGFQQHGMAIYRRQKRMTLKVAALPQGKDPDEVVLEDAAAWRQAIAGATSLPDFLFEVLPRRYDLGTVEGRRQLTERLGGIVVSCEADEQGRFLTRLERLVGVDSHTLEQVLGLSRRALLRQATARPTPRPSAAAAPFRRALEDPLERYTLGLLLRDPALRETAETLTPDHFLSAENREVFTAWRRCGTLELLEKLLDPLLWPHLQHLRGALSSVDSPVNARAEIADCIHRLEERHLRQMKKREAIGLDSETAKQEATVSVNAPEVLAVNQRLQQLFREREKRSNG